MNTPTLEELSGTEYVSVRKIEGQRRNKQPYTNQVFHRARDNTYWWMMLTAGADPQIIQVAPVTINGEVTYHQAE